MTVSPKRRPGARLLHGVGGWLRDWSLPRQIAGQDAFTAAAQSEWSRSLRPRVEDADRVGTSICPYCAVGCAQLAYVKGNDIIHIEGDPRSPINQGTLCPKGGATIGWIHSPRRLMTVKHRKPGSDHWDEVSLDWAMERIARLVKETRDATLRGEDSGRPHRQPHHGDRLPGRRDARQRRELPDQEAVRRRPRGGLDRKPGPGLTQRLRAQFGRQLRPGSGHDRAMGHRQQRLHPDHGLEHGRVPPDRLPLCAPGPTAAARRSSMSTPASPGPPHCPTSTRPSGPARTSHFSAG